jgi:uncharacterized membrane protein
MKMNADRIRLIAISIVGIFVIITGGFFAYRSFMEKEIVGGVLGIIVALIVLLFAFFVYLRGNRDLKDGYPIQDERSRKVMDRASSKSFFVSLYLLVAVGFISEELIQFRDVSQATGVTVGLMALTFACFWLYFNFKGDA